MKELIKTKADADSVALLKAELLKLQQEKAEAEAREKVRIAAEKKAALEKAEQNRKAELSERNRKLALEREISGLSTLWQMPFR